MSPERSSRVSVWLEATILELVSFRSSRSVSFKTTILRVPSHLPHTPPSHQLYVSYFSHYGRIFLVLLLQGIAAGSEGIPTQTHLHRNITISQDKLQIYTQHFVSPPIQQCVCQLFGRGHTQQPSLVCCSCRCSDQRVIGRRR